MLKKKLNKKQGFTLVEITITTGIVLLITAIAIFSFSKIRINVNDKAALNNVQTIAAAIDIYQMAYNDCLVNVPQLAAADPPYISDAFSDSRHQGYIYSTWHNPNNPKDCGVFAVPEVPGTTGTKYVVYRNRETRVFIHYSTAEYFLTGGIGSQ